MISVTSLVATPLRVEGGSKRRDGHGSAVNRGFPGSEVTRDYILADARLMPPDACGMRLAESAARHGATTMLRTLGRVGWHERGVFTSTAKVSRADPYKLGSDMFGRLVMGQ